jgi:type II secretory pathway component PulF
MPTFRYQALDAEQKLAAGELVADSVEQAIAQLQASGLIVQSISIIAPASPSTPRIPSDQTVGNSEQAALWAHMARVLEQSKLIAPALTAYAEEMPRGRRRRQLCTVVEVLNRGDVDAATSALTALPDYWIPLLSAATSSQDVGRILREFLDESRRADELRRQWWLTFAYPALILLLAASVFVLLSFIVVPLFAAIFVDFDLALPVFTRVIIALSSWVTNGTALIIALVCAVPGILILSSRRMFAESVRSFFADRFSGQLGQRTAVARFARFTADLLEGGLGTSDAIRIAGIAAQRPRLHAATERLADAIAVGPAATSDIAASDVDAPILSATVLFALRSALSMPARIQLLREISNCYATRARIRLSWVRGFVEPLSILVVGALVACIVVALFLPLVKLIEGLTA